MISTRRQLALGVPLLVDRTMLYVSHFLAKVPITWRHMIFLIHFCFLIACGHLVIVTFLLHRLSYIEFPLRIVFQRTEWWR